MTDSSHKTVTLVPMQYSGMYMANPGALFAILVIIAVPLLVLYWLRSEILYRGASFGRGERVGAKSASREIFFFVLLEFFGCGPRKRSE
jgi:hypothetical protein